MSLFEWISETFNPGPVGTVDRNDDSWQPKSSLAVWLLTVLGTALFALCLWGIWQSGSKLLWVLLLFVYLLLCRFLSPNPDARNMGWFGGLIDNPFRISDDFNRLLLFFAVFLLPGKVMWYAFQTLRNTFRSL